MRGLAWMLITLLALGFAACDLQKTIRATAPEPAATVGQRYLEDVRLGKYSELQANLNPKLAANPAMPQLLRKTTAFFPSGTPTSIGLIAWQMKAVTGGAVTYDLNYEYQFPKTTVVGFVQLQKVGERLEIETIWITPNAGAANEFTFKDKGPLHYIFLLLVIAIPLFTIVTVVACWRTPMKRLKWLWIIFILVGFMRFDLNWTTGAFGFSPIAFVLLGAMFSKFAYQPLVLSLAIPLGAIVFWIRRPYWLSEAQRTAAIFEAPLDTAPKPPPGKPAP